MFLVNFLHFDIAMLQFQFHQKLAMDFSSKRDLLLGQVDHNPFVLWAAVTIQFYLFLKYIHLILVLIIKLCTKAISTSVSVQFYLFFLMNESVVRAYKTQ